MDDHKTPSEIQPHKTIPARDADRRPQERVGLGLHSAETIKAQRERARQEVVSPDDLVEAETPRPAEEGISSEELAGLDARGPDVEARSPEVEARSPAVEARSPAVPCPHDSWEDLGGGARKCADCGQPIEDTPVGAALPDEGAAAGPGGAALLDFPAPPGAESDRLPPLPVEEGLVELDAEGAAALGMKPAPDFTLPPHSTHTFGRSPIGPTFPGVCLNCNTSERSVQALSPCPNATDEGLPTHPAPPAQGPAPTVKQSDLGKWLADGGDKGASAQLVRSLAALDERTEGAKRETQNAGRQAARDLVARITRDFTYHAPSRAQVGVYAEIRDRARTQAFYLLTVAPQSRELSLALSALEESVFWANAAIARNGIARSAPAPENALATADLHRYERPQEGDGRVPVCGTCGDIESSSVHAVEPAPSSIASAERPTAPFAVGERVREKHDPGAKPGIVERIEGGELWILWDDHGARGWAENEWDLYGYDAASALLGPE